MIIADLANGPDLVVFLGRNLEARAYLLDLKEAAAISCIKRFALDLRRDMRQGEK